MLNRERVEKEYLPMYQKYKLGTCIWSPLASGKLFIYQGRKKNQQRLKWFIWYIRAIEWKIQRWTNSKSQSFGYSRSSCH